MFKYQGLTQRFFVTFSLWCCFGLVVFADGSDVVPAEGEIKEEAAKIEATTDVLPGPPTPSSKASRVSFPSLDRVDPLAFNLKAGIGTAIDPAILWLTFGAELQLDKFLALGPNIQLGLSDNTTYVFSSLSPRFTLPFSYFEWFISAGAGLSYRTSPLTEFVNILYEASTGFEFYLHKNISVGGMFRANFLSSDAVERINVITGYVSGHF